MKITISRHVLADALAELAPLAGKNKALMVFNNIKIVTKGNRIRLQTSDGETTIRKYVEAEEIDQDGEFLVDCAALNVFIGKVKGATIILDATPENLTIKHEKGKLELPVLPASEFVEPYQEDELEEVSVPSAVLSNLVSVAKNFVATDTLRPNLTAIRAIVADNKLTVCATDTHALFADKVHISAEGKDIQWYISPNIFSALTKACKEANDVIVKVSEYSVVYRIGMTTIFSKQPKGNFPNFNRVIPQSHSIDASCDKKELAESIQRTMLFTEESRLIKVSVSGLSMDIQGDNYGKLQKAVENVTCTSSSDINFGVNAKILANCVNAVQSDEIKMELTAPERPIVFKDENNPERVVLCMPMALVSQ